MPADSLRAYAEDESRRAQWIGCVHFLDEIRLDTDGVLCVRRYYKGVRQMVPVSDQEMNTHLAEVSRVRAPSSFCKTS